jgi:hypothetical protein
VADGHGAREIKQNMDMVLDGVDEHHGTPEILQDGGHVGVQRIPHGVRENPFAVFGAEDEVDVQSRKGLWHGWTVSQGAYGNHWAAQQKTRGRREQI